MTARDKSEQTTITIQMRPPRRPPFLAIAAAAVIALAAGGLFIWASTLNNRVRTRIETVLADRFQAEINFKQFNITLFPSFRLLATGMVVRRESDADLPPLMEAVRVQGEGPLLWILIGHIRRVKIEGLSLNIPLLRHESTRGPQKRRSSLVIDEITSDGAHLEILRTKSDKPPLEFRIHHLEMKGVDLDTSFAFYANLENPEPRGEIETRGNLGPWIGGEPSLTPISGDYTLSRADLASFNGIGGTLWSKGKYKGVLQRLEVDGEANTPDFTLAMAQHPVPLVTSFHAIVDGSNGNTTLERVEGKLNNTPISASGEVLKVQDAHGRRILFDGAVKNGRLEDLLRLVVRSSPAPLSGMVSLDTKIDLPPGDEDVITKLRLSGNFDIHSARFSSVNIREKLRSLSRKAQGLPGDPEAGSSISNLRGSFELNRGIATFSNLAFEVEGASIQLAGRYELQSEQMDFRGKLIMDAKLSQTTTGVKAFFLKALNPFFRSKDGGSEIPIRISGTRTNPSFALEIRKKF